MKPKEQSLTELLNTVIPICNYRGCIVTRLIGGYEVLNQRCKTPAEVDNIINKANESLSNSITK